MAILRVSFTLAHVKPIASLRALLRKPLILGLSILSAVLPAISRAEDGGYLFVTFRGEATPLSEQIHFGISRDGLKWDALNKGEPVLISKLGEKGVRDPFILRSQDGSKTWIIATDLSIHLNRDWTRAQERGSRSIVIWESTDLVHWSKPSLAAVAPRDAGCTWAPEAIYSEETKDYLVFWASRTREDKFAKQRIWATRTKDFRSFSKPFIFIENPNHVIDTTIVHENGAYFRFSKDEQVKSITMETAEHLKGPWKTVQDFSLARLEGYEGPTCYPLTPAKDGKPGTWCLMIDHYSKGQGYKPFITSDLASGKFEPAGEVGFPFLFRHGSVLKITEKEYTELTKAYATPAR